LAAPKCLIRRSQRDVSLAWMSPLASMDRVLAKKACWAPALFASAFCPSQRPLGLTMGDAPAAGLATCALRSAPVHRPLGPLPGAEPGTGRKPRVPTIWLNWGVACCRSYKQTMSISEFSRNQLPRSGFARCARSRSGEAGPEASFGASSGQEGQLPNLRRASNAECRWRASTSPEHPSSQNSLT
jgi:hypothetical protein